VRKNPNVAVVGATGAVGEAMLRVLAERKFPVGKVRALASARSAGLEVAFFDAINPDDQDFTPILTNIGGASLDAVYFTGYHAQGGLLLRQTAELGLDIQWMMGNASNNPEMVEIAGVDAAAGTFITTEPLPQDLEYPEAVEFVEAFTEAYGEPPASVWWLLAAEAFNVIAHAIQETESTDTEVLAAYLHEEFKDYPGLSGPRPLLPVHCDATSTSRLKTAR